MGNVHSFKFHEFQCPRAIDENASARPTFLLSHPVSPAVLADHENRRPEARGRLSCLFSSCSTLHMGRNDAHRFYTLMLLSHRQCAHNRIGIRDEKTLLVISGV